jgi:cell wall-associated NlpC family hydrolase
MTPQGDQPYDADLTVEELTSPDRVRVSDSQGVLATLTVGAKSVVVRGQPRTFTEQKRVGAAYRDDFSRTTTSGLGLSPFYGLWSKPIGGVPTDFTCDGSTGRIAVRSTNFGHYCTLRDGDVRDYDMRCKVTTTTVPAGASNSFALIGSYLNRSSHYRFRLVLTTAGGVRLAVEKNVDDVVTNLSAATTIGNGYAAGQQWWVRAQNINSALRIKAWKDGDTEPDGWTHTVQDSSLSVGRVGVRCHTASGATNSPTFVIDDFEITSGEWAHPPTVSHDSWLRLLSNPFDGAWTSALADQILAWAADTSPDALAYGFAFITGASAVVDLQLGAGKQVLGEGRYGPNHPDGTRVEGADFNDYIGIRWNYSHLAVPTVDIPEASQLNCLDCSGFLRMVFGFHLDVPMCLQEDADLNGLNLPRRSVQIAPSGPGVLIAQGSGAPPTLTGLQIGDVVAFNADVLDDQSGDDRADIEENDDHVGIYIGHNLSGDDLCLSSRKTANGPTIGALGGASQLNGDGFLAVALRHIRRI